MPRNSALRVARRFLLAGDDYHPPGHKVGEKVPKGGSSCANCRFASKDGKHCSNEHFQRWHGDEGSKDPAKLPAPADEYCCDLWDLQK